MTSFRILHVDDDPLMRDIVELALALDPRFTLTSCAGGQKALAKVADAAPDLILCDVMMPDMDGPAMVARLRENTSTATIPVIFMTTLAEAGKLEQLKSLDGAAVIVKPFDPAKLADQVRGQLRAIKFASAGYDFAERLRTDAAMLATFRNKLAGGSDSSFVPEGLQTCVHKLAGAAGVFDFQAVSRSASALEQAIVATCAGRGTAGTIAANLDALLECMERE